MQGILNNQLEEKAAKIKYFFCDIDGTLTDGGVYYSLRGEEMKKFSLRDGTGFFLLRKCNIKTGFITTESSPVVAQRAKKLKIDAYLHGTCKKLDSMSDFLEKTGCTFDEIAYIGDELNDVKLLKECGLSFAVSDADESVKAIADIICNRKGGDGAFREAVGVLLKLRHVNVEQIVEYYL